MSLIIIFLVLFITSCRPDRDLEAHYPLGISSYGDIRPYALDPKTILTALDRDEARLFQPLSDWTSQETVFLPGSFAWQQQDYLKIANALNRVANHDNLEGWSIYKIYAERDCSDTPVGLDDFSITYFKIVGERYTTRLMDIHPLKKEADWAESSGYPRPFPFGWKSIDLGKLKVTADKAFQMAEANGGKAARQADKNNCIIFTILSPNGEHPNWDIYYDSGGSLVLFEFHVDPY